MAWHYQTITWTNIDKGNWCIIVSEVDELTHWGPDIIDAISSNENFQI